VNTTVTNALATSKKESTNRLVEVVFLKEGDTAKMVPVKRGISDQYYLEITDGLKGGEDVISGTYKAINRDLEDGKKIIIGKGEIGGTADKKP
jgi:HlyD family secretion protein